MSNVVSENAKVAELEQKLEKNKADLRDLSMMGAVITSIHELRSILSVVMEMATRLVDAEVVAVLLEDKSSLKIASSIGISGEIIHHLEFDESSKLVNYVFENKKGVIKNDFSDSALFSNIKTSLTIPIQTDNKCFGVLILLNKYDGSEYNQEDFEKIDMLLNFVAVALDNIDLLNEKLEQQKVEQEMAIARQIQETILPSDIDIFEKANIGAIFYPAKEVGGDFYDIIKLTDSKYAVILGDVSNKGVPAALIMSAASGIIKSILDSNPDMSINKIAEKINNMLVNEIIKEREMFITLFFSIFDMKNMVLTYTNCGHLPGLLWQNENKEIIELGQGGPIVGQFADIKYKFGGHKISKGDRLFLFTDGLTEAADRNGKLFGLKRAKEMFVKEVDLNPKVFCLTVKDWIDKFTVDCPDETVDDFTILQIEVSDD